MIDTPLPFWVGSGKFGIPCARMHLASFRSVAMALCSCAAGNWPKPLGSRLLQALFADWYWEEARSMPLMMKFPWLVGSGQAGSPCERMHCA